MSAYSQRWPRRALPSSWLVCVGAGTTKIISMSGRRRPPAEIARRCRLSYSCPSSERRNGGTCWNRIDCYEQLPSIAIPKLLHTYIFKKKHIYKFQNVILLWLRLRVKCPTVGRLPCWTLSSLPANRSCFGSWASVLGLRQPSTVQRPFLSR